MEGKTKRTEAKAGSRRFVPLLIPAVLGGWESRILDHKMLFILCNEACSFTNTIFFNVAVCGP